MKRFLDIIGDLRIAFWLLLSAALVMWIGSIICLNNYSLIDSLNGSRIQEWLPAHLRQHPGATWWIPLLFLVFFLLGINTMACTARRILNLIPAGRGMSAKGFLVALSPSIIHLLFMLMLSGHLLGFAMVEFEKVPVRQGEEAVLKNVGTVRVASVTHQFFPRDSLLRGRVRQSRMILEFPRQGVPETAVLEFLRPVYRGGYIIQLDMERKKRTETPRIADPETCNRETHFNFSGPKNAGSPRLYLAVTRDPGLFVLFPGFIAVILIMGWYFYQVTLGSGRNAR
ncbi:MAG: hypothetical protein JXA20_07245 [Spirochaetes bacterium]|nr:hypothetical protein [Spirochaetota bacterium]